MTNLRQEPLFFGPSERPLFGWIHHPEASVESSALGLVLCNPFGYEAICAHRTLRHLATKAAELGIPSIRFDYDGCGDSSGDDFDTDRVNAWINSIQSACETLKEVTGVTSICLLGIRLGATLAMMAALARSDIAGIITIAPVAKARTYLRELRALQTAIGGTVDHREDLLEVAGYAITDQTMAALADIDLLTLARKPAERILIIDRNNLPSAKALTNRLLTLGSTVDYQCRPGYEDMASTPHAQQLPLEILNATTTWLVNLLVENPRKRTAKTGIPRQPSIRAYAQLPSADRTEDIEESAEFLNPTAQLFAITTQPLQSQANALGRYKKTGLLLINAGATHHVGPGRLYVTAARQWARLGHVVMRMDISGIGDSTPPLGSSENDPYDDHARADIDLALAVLRERYQVNEVLAIGLCSGAYHAFKSAVAGAALAGVTLINPLTFFWKKGMSLDTEFSAGRVAQDSARYQRNVFRAESWRKIITGKVDLRDVTQIIVRQILTKCRTIARNSARALGISLHDDLVAELAAIVDSGISLDFVFSASDPGYKLLQAQGGTSVVQLRQSGKLGITTIENANHTFTNLASRNILISNLTRIIERQSASA